MALSAEMRRLEARWKAKTAWPKWLEWLEIDGIRGWTGTRFSCDFPIMAVVGENGVGKSTILQAAAAVYRPPRSRKVKRPLFASDFFPDTAWEKTVNAEVRYSVREGIDNRRPVDSIKKPGARWRRNPQRPERDVVYIDLSRVQPVAGRVGFSRLAKVNNPEVSAQHFEAHRLAALREVMARPYERARMSRTKTDNTRQVAVLGVRDDEYSGFHQGAGETTVVELLLNNFPQTGLVLIDEIETSLHPRAQRRLMRYLANLCRDQDIQVILTTHSPTILEELPVEARAYVMFAENGRGIMYGTSPEFAMAKMDDIPITECDIYVEDDRAKAMLTEILSVADPELVQRCLIIPAGAASVGQALGSMVADGRFPRPSCVFLDGDQGKALGCANLPGDDSPERVVFSALYAAKWPGISGRIGRAHPDVVDACERAMTLSDEHEWTRYAATKLVVGSANLWQALCAEWATNLLDGGEAKAIAQVVRDSLEGIAPNQDAPPPPTPRLARALPPQRPKPKPKDVDTLSIFDTVGS